jgi:SP family general alpha glucoside:H+ symporter-like MFS transporter
MADLKSTAEVTNRLSDHEIVAPTEDHEKNAYKESALDSTILNAKLATDKEHRMTLLQGIKLYPKAVFWSVLISTCIVMEGYDISLINNFYAFETFNRKYGVEIAPGKFQVPAAWQAGLSNGANVGEIIGLFINGFVSERFGYR